MTNLIIIDAATKIIVNKTEALVEKTSSKNPLIAASQRPEFSVVFSNKLTETTKIIVNHGKWLRIAKWARKLA